MEQIQTLQLLVKINLRSWASKVSDPPRELLERMILLTRVLQDGRQELAQAGATLAGYQERETNLQKQIDYHNGLAKKFLKNEDVAKAHLAEVIKLESQLADAKKAIAEFEKQAAELQASVEAGQEQLNLLEQTYNQIKAIKARTGQLSLLHQMTEAHEKAKELKEKALHQADVAETRLEVEGTPIPGANKSDAEVEARLATLKAERNTKGGA